MSMISELISELRDLEDDWEIDCYGNQELRQVCKKAADTIEELSTKLHASQMERSSQHYNGGWILCDERLPENLEKVLVWYEYYRYGDYNCMCETYGIGWHLDGHWSGDVSGTKARCIAWRPLPEPYNKTEA